MPSMTQTENNVHHVDTIKCINYDEILIKSQSTSIIHSPSSPRTPNEESQRMVETNQFYVSSVTSNEPTYECCSGLTQNVNQTTSDIQNDDGHHSTTEQHGEPSHCEHCERSEDGEQSQSQTDQLYEDRYFPLIIDNIGTYNMFTKKYIKYNEIIGRGTECIVYKGEDKLNGNQIAIQYHKCKNKGELIHWFAKYLIIKQCDFYTEFNAFIGHSEDDIINKQEDFTIILVQELLDKNITEIMSDIVINKQTSSSANNDCKNERECVQEMDESEVQLMVKQIVEQLDILTSKHNYCHLDIKPTNIMRKIKKSDDECNKYTLIDFGFAVECNTEIDGYIGTKEWSAPEMKPIAASHNNKNVESEEITVYESSDMWSIGLLIIYCLYNGTHPFLYTKKSKNKRIRDGSGSIKTSTLKDIEKWYNKRIKNKQCYIESWLGKQLITNKISYNLFDFLFKCLKYDPSKRLTPKQALQHKWLK